MCECIYVCVCVYGSLVTLWMTSFKGAIKRACLWAVDLSYESSLERQRMEKRERASMKRKGDVTECMMCVCILFKSQI